MSYQSIVDAYENLVINKFNKDPSIPVEKYEYHFIKQCCYEPSLLSEAYNSGNEKVKSACDSVKHKSNSTNLTSRALSLLAFNEVKIIADELLKNRTAKELLIHIFGEKIRGKLFANITSENKDTIEMSNEKAFILRKIKAFAIYDSERSEIDDAFTLPLFPMTKNAETAIRNIKNVWCVNFDNKLTVMTPYESHILNLSDENLKFIKNQWVLDNGSI